MPGDLDERTLVQRARAGEDTAFADLLEAHRDRLWAVCFRITGNRHDAEDALQDAIVSAWRNLDRFRGDSRFSTWLYRIAANAALMLVRRRRDVPSSDDALFDRLAEADRTERVVDGDAVQQAVSQLPDHYRAALVLRVWGDCSYDEIATWLDIPVQTVKSRLNRARQAVARELDHNGARP